jgi:hypothetical protein
MHYNISADEFCRRATEHALPCRSHPCVGPHGHRLADYAANIGHDTLATLPRNPKPFACTKTAEHIVDRLTAWHP